MMGGILSSLYEWTMVALGNTNTALRSSFTWLSQTIITSINSTVALIPRMQLQTTATLRPSSLLEPDHDTDDKSVQNEDIQQEDGKGHAPVQQIEQPVVHTSPVKSITSVVSSPSSPLLTDKPTEQASPPQVPAIISQEAAEPQETQEEKIQRWKEMDIARKMVADEILMTEGSYVAYLQCVRDVFINPMREKHLLTKDDSRALFSEWMVCNDHLHFTELSYHYSQY